MPKKSEANTKSNKTATTTEKVSKAKSKATVEDKKVETPIGTGPKALPKESKSKTKQDTTSEDKATESPKEKKVPKSKAKKVEAEEPKVEEPKKTLKGKKKEVTPKPQPKKIKSKTKVVDDDESDKDSDKKSKTKEVVVKEPAKKSKPVKKVKEAKPTTLDECHKKIDELQKAVDDGNLNQYNIYRENIKVTQDADDVLYSLIRQIWKMKNMLEMVKRILDSNTYSIEDDLTLRNYIHSYCKDPTVDEYIKNNQSKTNNFDVTLDYDNDKGLDEIKQHYEELAKIYTHNRALIQ